MNQSLRVFLLALFLLLQFHHNTCGQEGIVNRSTTTHKIDGRLYYFHAVLQGQTLYSIARAYGVGQEDIIAANPDIRHGLNFDQVIRIPVPFASPEEEVASFSATGAREFGEHEVVQGETLFGLSQQFGLPIEEILYYNPESRTGLRIGQRLRIPLRETQAGIARELADDPGAEFFLYTVAAGETKYGLSRQFGITIEALEALNPGTEDGLRTGQQIRLPKGPLPEVAGTPEETSPPPPAAIEVRLPSRSRTAGHPRAEPYCYEPEHKDHYQVALLIPLYLDALNPDTIDGAYQEEGIPGMPLPDTLSGGTLTRPSRSRVEAQARPGLDHRSFTFVPYYHGVLLALDSIKQQGAGITLHVFDVDENLASASSVTRQQGFSEMDLIIGPFHRRTLDHIAAYGRRHDIPVVSPLLPGIQLLEGFPNLFTASPSLEAMLRSVSGYVSQHHATDNIIVVHNNQPGAARLIRSFQDTLLTRVAMVNHFYDSLNLARVNGYYFDEALVGSRRTNVLVMPERALAARDIRSVARPANVREVLYELEGMEGLVSKLRPDQINVIITLISGEPFLSDYLRRLHQMRRDYDMAIFGIPEWENYSSIEFDYLQDLKVHLFSPVFYDYRDPHIRDFVERYRRVFGTEPLADAFKGVQTAYFFFNALHEYGKGFPRCMPLLNRQAYDTPFLFERPLGSTGGWENQHTFIHRIENYRRVDAQRLISIGQHRDED